jgi:hypothetical protein
MKTTYTKNIMNLTPENLVNLPIGKYAISRKPYITSPDYVQQNELHVYEYEGEKCYAIGKFHEKFTLRIDTSKESDSLRLVAFVMVSDNLFEMSSEGIYELKKYLITIPV